MGVKLGVVISSIFFIFLLLFFYFVPFKTTNFGFSDGNFSSFGNYSNMQFFANMRFPERQISYKIWNCSLKKQNEMQFAFEVLGKKTTLEFYPVASGQEISVFCEEKDRLNNDSLFVGGEGGPLNMTAIGNFVMILRGQILLIRESNCAYPNIALHELLHVLGFKHSENPKNIMYHITDCDQTIGEDMIQLINSLYAIPSAPDLIFENVSAEISGRFLDADINVANAGFKNSQDFKISIYADKQFVKSLEMDSLERGYARFIGAKNIWVPQINVKELRFVIESDFEEINKENNELFLNVK